MPKQKIYIADSYSLNTGDIGILLATIAAITEKKPDLEIYIEASHPSVLKDYDLPHRIFPRVFDISHIVGTHSSKTQLMKNCVVGIYDSISFLLYALLYRLRIPSLWLIRPSRKEQAQLLKSIDVWLSSGGGFLSSYYKFELRLYGYWLAIILKKPYVIFAQSVGPFFGKFHNYLARVFLNKARLITIREPDSIQYITTLGLTQQPILTADIAFLLPFHTANLPIDIKAKTVAVCVKSGDTNYMRSITGAAEYLLSKGFGILYVSQTPNDDTTAKQLAQATSSSTEYFPFSLDPRTVKGIYAQCEFIIASRMHAIIFASERGVRWIGIGYEPKFRGLAEQLNETGILIEEKSLTKASLTQAIDDVLLMPKVHHSRQTSKLLTKSRENISLLVAKAL
ncbi:MAG: polysaccharide pyruvyl transferase family protein [Candidatus Saccharimonadales bacterium]